MSKGKPIADCTACGSEIVETVNDSLFRDGECDACEYQRYRTQPVLLERCKMHLLDAQHALSGDWIPTPEGWQATIDDLKQVIAEAEGR